MKDPKHHEPTFPRPTPPDEPPPKPATQRLDDLVARSPSPRTDRERRLEELSVAAHALGELVAYFPDVDGNPGLLAAERVATEIANTVCPPAKKP